MDLSPESSDTQEGDAVVTGDLVRPDMSQLGPLKELLEQALESWEAVRDTCGPEVAGDPLKDLALAVLLAGYAKRTV